MFPSLHGIGLRSGADVVRGAFKSILLAGLSALAGSVAAFAGQSVTFVVTGADARPAAGVVLYFPDVHTPVPASDVVIDQRNEAFMPAIAVAPVGSVVQFTNSDRTSHHVYSFSRPNAFALPLYKGDARLSQRFASPGVVVLGCNIHDSMLGYIVVVDSTRSGVTGADGRLTLPDVPAGRHAVRAWAPGLDRAAPPEVGQVDVGASAPASLALRLGIVVSGPAPRQRGALVGGDY
ncbi:MAG: carboxypeptidase regulatory-like domain-containing protein [Gammaproteobacteria bacterium]